MSDESQFGEDPRIPRVNVHVFKADGSIQSNALQTVEDETAVWSEAGAIPPPYDQRVLTVLMEHSNSLRQNIDAYATNVDSFGHSFTPIVDLEADDTVDRVRSVMMVSAELAGEEPAEPSTAEVEKFTKKLEAEQRMELLKLEAFFEYCSSVSFPELRAITRQDIENTGNGYWEVLRNLGGDVSKFNHVESWTVRLMPLDMEYTQTDAVRRKADLDFETVKEQKRFRRFVQRVGDKFVFFKEFGDPRAVSAETGKAYPDLAALYKAETRDNGVKPRVANELVHFKVHSSRTAYGIPRWIGNLLSVLGSRQCEEVNFAYFENKSVPPLAVLVSGGRLGKDAVNRLQDYIKNEIRGKDNFHKILVIEAEASNSSTVFENSGQTKIELKPLVEAQTSDALFQNYDERNIDKVGMAFRLPRMLRGDTRDFNRSTSYAALDFAERQVFEPLRQVFDYWVNRHILLPRKIKHWRYKSNGPMLRDPEALSKMIHDLGDVLTPNTALELAQDVFGRRFGRITEEWGDRPLKLTIADIATKNNVAGGPTGSGETPEADDANPDNDPANSETTQTNAVSDNKGEQGKTRGQPRVGGKFGTKGPKAKPKAPSRPKVKKAAVETVAKTLSVLADVLEASEVEATVERIQQSRREPKE